MTEQATDLAELHDRFVEITVNKKPVRIEGQRATGLEIKEAAIAQDVQIELDFQLASVHGDHRRIVGDSDVVELQEHEKFVATASDDNS
jgi:hypothetical protein